MFSDVAEGRMMSVLTDMSTISWANMMRSCRALRNRLPRSISSSDRPAKTPRVEDGNGDLEREVERDEDAETDRSRDNDRLRDSRCVLCTPRGAALGRRRTRLGLPGIIDDRLEGLAKWSREMDGRRLWGTEVDATSQL